MKHCVSNHLVVIGSQIAFWCLVDRCDRYAFKFNCHSGVLNFFRGVNQSWVNSRFRMLLVEMIVEFLPIIGHKEAVITAEPRGKSVIRTNLLNIIVVVIT